MNKCIICREETNNFSDEHVIPDSLGGNYHIKTVCKNCNSHLGLYVDAPLVNHWYSEFVRFKDSILGKSGKIPNPLASKVASFKNNSEQKVRIDKDSSGNIYPYFIPNVGKPINHPDGSISLTITGDKRDEAKLSDIMDKKIKQLSEIHPEKQILKELPQSVSFTPEIHIRKEVDLIKYKIGLLKIAYEFAVDSLPNYFSDETAIKISQILQPRPNVKEPDYVKASDFCTEIEVTELAKMFPFIDFQDTKKDFLILTDIEEKLFCIVALHDSFHVFVHLSENNYLHQEEIIIGINEYKKPPFKKYNLIEVVLNK